MDGLAKHEVAVVCLTCNHEDYIAQALEGFLSQETTFSFEVVVADDCSHDATREILAEYAEANPGRIKVLLPEQKQGAERNLIAACNMVQATYIALCDGDDYWTDALKLQKQYDYMQANPDMRACFHDTEIVQEGQTEWFLAQDYANTSDGKLRWSTGHRKFAKKDAYSIEDYIPCGFVHSSSMFFRWDRNLKIPDWYYSHILGDYTLWILQVGRGRFGFIDETMSVYRRRGNSAYDFLDRCDYWDKTREDWVLIDADLADYFTHVQPYPEAVALLKSRMKDDLRKLFIARYTFGMPDEFNALAQRFDPFVEFAYGCSLLEGDCPSYRQVARAARKVMGFPLHDVLKLRRLQRLMKRG